MTVGRSENGSDDLWIREMGLSAKNGKTSKPEKLKMDRRKMRSEWETCSENSPWASTESELGSEWIGVGRNSDRSGSERIEVEWIGVWVGIRLEWIGAERIGVDRRDFRRDSLGVDLPLFRFRCGVDRSFARERIGAGFEWLRRGVSGSELQRAWLRRGVSGSELQRAVRVWELVRVREFRKSIEVKITTESNFSRFWLIFRSNWKCFQFDRILQHNQTRDFPEIDFRKSILVETNGA